MHLGCDVTTAGSSEECLRVVSPEHKVVFMDVCTGLDGYELA
ncbi:ethylene receptor-like protein, partial [Trifolium medium]|nr:ethylene receptor-like protein [Trifolium medium]